jgi:hypothetical protein
MSLYFSNVLCHYATNSLYFEYVCIVGIWCCVVCVFLRRRELQEVQALYRQSSEHAAEQAQLIQQLEGLNLDTQRVLRNQEEAHTADTTSYQKVTNYTIYYHSIHLHYNTQSPL